ncbi:hypothetical protein GE21DRAFT_1282017 [Neurospora crassa]|nr:hypothetical protein GE21DRAFT_1282017 [Neurospora crassa]
MDPLTSMHFHVNKVAPLPRGRTSLSAGSPQNYPATEPPWTVLVGLGKPVSSHLSLNTDRPFTTRHPRHHRRQHSQVEIFGHNSSYVHMLWQLDNFKFMTYSYESLFGPSYTPALLLDSFKHVGADNGIAI